MVGGGHGSGTRVKRARILQAGILVMDTGWRKVVRLVVRQEETFSGEFAREAAGHGHGRAAAASRLGRVGHFVRRGEGLGPVLAVLDDGQDVFAQLAVLVGDAHELFAEGAQFGVAVFDDVYYAGDVVLGGCRVLRLSVGG